jgi:hypothetical protein
MILGRVRLSKKCGERNLEWSKGGGAVHCASGRAILKQGPALRRTTTEIGKEALRNHTESNGHLGSIGASVIHSGHEDHDHWHLWASWTSIS